jgi:hypothetical protein
MLLNFFISVLENITASILLSYIIVPLIMMTSLGAILRIAFHQLNSRKEMIAFGFSSFVLFMALIYAVGTRPQSPALSGVVQSVVIGSGIPNQDAVTVLTANVINTGTMQTIVKNWRVTARVNGHDYQGSFPQMTDSFTFSGLPNVSPNQPTSITYHKADNLLDKSLVPIQVGSMLTGLLFVAFQHVDVAVFKTGVDYTVTYEDVFSRSYTMQISTSGVSSVIGVAPGIKAEMACQMPAGGLPKLGNDITSSVTPNASLVPATKPAISP